MLSQRLTSKLKGHQNQATNKKSPLTATNSASADFYKLVRKEIAKKLPEFCAIKCFKWTGTAWCFLVPALLLFVFFKDGTCTS